MINSMKILVIDDDEAILKFITAILKQEGIDTLTATDSFTAHQQLSQNPDITVVITDIILPGQEGIEIIRKIKSQHPRIKIIAISGGGKISPENYLHLAHVMGVNATLKKPFGPKELLNALQRL